MQFELDFCLNFISYYLNIATTDKICDFLMHRPKRKCDIWHLLLSWTCETNQTLERMLFISLNNKLMKEIKKIHHLL